MGQKRAIKRQRPIKRDKGVKASQWRKQFSKQIMLKQLYICMFLKKSWSKFHTVYQNELKLVLSLNVKSKSIKRNDILVHATAWVSLENIISDL